MRGVVQRLVLALLLGSLVACQGEPPASSARKAVKRPGAAPVAPQAVSPSPSASPVAGSPTPTSPTPATVTPGVPGPGAGGSGGGAGGAGAVTPSRAELQLVRASQAPDTWTTWPALRRPRAGLAAGVVGTFVMVSDGEPRATNEAMSLDEDGATGWGLSSAGSSAPGVTLAAFASNGARLLMVGGNAGELLPVTRAEEPEGGALLPKLYVPEPVRAAAGAWAPASGEVLVFGGETYNGLTAVVRRIAVEAERVSQGASAPEPFAGAAAAVVGSKAWVVGGYALLPDGAVQALTTVRVYDVASNAWRVSGDGQAAAPPALPAPRHSGALVAMGGKLWLLGGAGADGRPLGEVLRLDPAAAAPAWEAVTALPTPRALLAAVGIGPRLMAIGGVGAAGQPLDTVEVYQP
jgi:hypothetical protein